MWNSEYNIRCTHEFLQVRRNAFLGNDGNVEMNKVITQTKERNYAGQTFLPSSTYSTLVLCHDVSIVLPSPG